jgi:hypothetical protein
MCVSPTRSGNYTSASTRKSDSEIEDPRRLRRTLQISHKVSNAHAKRLGYDYHCP